MFYISYLTLLYLTFCDDVACLCPSSIIRQQGARVLLSKQVKYVKEMKEEGTLKSKHADTLFQMIEADLDNLNQHKFEVFKENVQRVFSNRMSMLTTTKGSVVARDTSTDTGGEGGLRNPTTTFRPSGLSNIDEEANCNHTTTSGQSEVSHPHAGGAPPDNSVRDNSSSFSVSRATVDRDSDL